MKTEYLSPDILEHNFVQCFAPIHLVQLMTGTLRVDIRDQFVTQSTTCQKIYRWGCIILGIFTMIDILINYYKAFPEHPIVYGTFSGALLMYSGAILSTYFHINYFHENDNVAVYLTLQRVDNFFRLGRLPDINNNQYYIHIILIYIAVPCLTTAATFFFFLLFGYLPSTGIIAAFSTNFIYLDLLMMLSTLFYTTDRLKILKSIFTSKVSRDMNTVYRTLGRNKIYLDNRLLPIAESLMDLELKGYVVCLNNILQTFKTTGKLYRFQIFLYIASVFIWAFLVIAASVEGTQTKLVPGLALFIMYAYLLFFFAVITVMVLICNSYKREIEDLRTICIDILARSCALSNDPVKKVAKKILHLTEDESQHEISVYKIFKVNLALPLKLIVLIADYTIVMIQVTMPQIV